MQLNHINLVVTDVPAAIRLFEDHLGFTCIDNRRDVVAVLMGSDNFVMVLWSSTLNKTDDVAYPENFHIGFYQANKESVLALYEKLNNENLVFESEPKKLRNTFGFYFHFDKLLIEISVLPQHPLLS